MSEVRFIRKNGRVIPVRDSKGGDSHHGKFAVAGAAQNVAARAAAKSVLLKKPSVKAFGATMALGLGTFAANVVNAAAHGDNKNSTLHGVGRYLTNVLAVGAGSLGAQVAAKAAPSLAAKAKPHTSQYREWRKFKNAKEVPAESVKSKVSGYLK